MLLVKVMMIGAGLQASAWALEPPRLTAPQILSQGFTPVQNVSVHNIEDYHIAAGQLAPMLKHFCTNLERHFKKYGWKKEQPCDGVEWKAMFKTPNGHPLIYAAFGSGEQTTLMMSAVHPDELTPLPMGFRFAKHVAANPEVVPENSRVVIAPLVNPDGFVRNTPSRTNANGVDLNRNFFTIDWYQRSAHLWKSRGRRKKHYPGYLPNSEIETIFQIQLIEHFKPDKILSVHAPLGFLDYDGPGDGKRRPSTEESRAKELVHAIAKKASNYRVVDYSFYPGSLGNFAGNERKIPTVTLELQGTDPKAVDRYWKKFLPGLIDAIHYPFRNPPMQGSGNASHFYTGYMTKSSS